MLKRIQDIKSEFVNEHHRSIGHESKQRNNVKKSVPYNLPKVNNFCISHFFVNIIV